MGFGVGVAGQVPPPRAEPAVPAVPRQYASGAQRFVAQALAPDEQLTPLQTLHRQGWVLLADAFTLFGATREAIRASKFEPIFNGDATGERFQGRAAWAGAVEMACTQPPEFSSSILTKGRRGEPYIMRRCYTVLLV